MQGKILITWLAIIGATMGKMQKQHVKAGGKFEIDAANNRFLLNGNAFRYISGTLHYFRIPERYWEDRLLKLRAMGANAVQIYVEWNVHEPNKRQYNFKGIANVVKFIKIAHKLKIYVIFRPGPYIDAEQDMGGYPAWLLKYKGIRLRTSDPRYLAEVKTWFDVLLPKIRPLLITHGGPVIMVQVENEYGSYYACDHNYTAWLRDLLKQHLGSGIVYFTVDGTLESLLACGTVPGTYPTVDFGSSNHTEVDSYLALQRKFAKTGGPFANPEFYTGWFSEWNVTHRTVDAGDVLSTMAYLHSLNASFNFYPMCGGTNWGFSAGAELYNNAQFAQVLTSYDFDAPVSEAGDLTPKWFALRQEIERLQGHPVPFATPQSAPKVWYGKVTLRRMGSLFRMLDKLSSENDIKNSTYPQSVEDLDFYYGFVLYHTMIDVTSLLKNGKKKAELRITNLNDRGYIFINKQRVEVVQRPVNAVIHLNTSSFSQADQTIHLDILVENQGRICYGSFINDSKGLLSNVTLHFVDDVAEDDDEPGPPTTSAPLVLTNWTHTHVQIDHLIGRLRQTTKSLIPYSDEDGDVDEAGRFLPGVYASAPFDATPYVGDTYVDTTGWGKGQAYAGTGQNLGRYWPLAGPQMTLYHPFIRRSGNRLVFFELERANCGPSPGNCWARLINQPIWSTAKLPSF